MKQNYLPYTDNEKRAWLNNFDTQLATLGSGLGISPAEITANHNDTLAVNYVMDILEIFKNETKERTRYKDLLFDGAIGTPLGDLPSLPTLPVAPTEVPAGVFKRIAKMVQRIKNHADYNEALGQNLGIIGPEKVIDIENLKVQITLRRSNNDGVALDFVKGQMDGVVVYAAGIAQKVVAVPVPPAEPPVDFPAGTYEPPVVKWIEIGRATTSPFIDSSLNAGSHPETRAYMMRYLRKDVPVGKDSDIISVIANVQGAGNDLASKVK